MKENYKTSNYPGGKTKIETYKENDTFITKLYHNSRSGFVKEFTSEKDGIKEIKHFNEQGALSKLEYFKNDKRDGVETKYLVSKPNKSVKSTKTYSDGKLHGEAITYNDSGEIIKQEVFVLGKVALKYLREDKNSSEITKVEVLDEESLLKLSQEEQDLIQKIRTEIK